jgi:hypothetical protein
MVWRRVQVPSTMTLREFHGEQHPSVSVHRAHGSVRLMGVDRRTADVVLDDLKLRKGSRFLYEYESQHSLGA